MKLTVLCWLIFAGILASAEPVDALAELNADRAKRGLPAYQRDEALTQAASAAATYRAERLMSGHTGNDFAFLPTGVKADAAGCAMWKDGFGACTMHSTEYTTAGAAFVIGKNGMRFCHLFVRRGPPTATTVSFRETPAKPATGAVDYSATPPKGVVYCKRLNSDGTVTTWAEPAPDWLNTPGAAKTMPTTIPCNNGSCPKK